MKFSEKMCFTAPHTSVHISLIGVNVKYVSILLKSPKHEAYRLWFPKSAFFT